MLSCLSLSKKKEPYNDEVESGNDENESSDSDDSIDEVLEQI